LPNFYLEWSLYYERTKAYLDNFDKVHILSYDDFIDDEKMFMRKILNIFSLDQNFDFNTDIKYRK